MNLFLSLNGSVEAIYAEKIELEKLGNVTVARASAIEWHDGYWSVRWPDGTTISRFRRRSQALAWEERVINHQLRMKHQCRNTSEPGPSATTANQKLPSATSSGGLIPSTP
jgi:hypothetical protein